MPEGPNAVPSQRRQPDVASAPSARGGQPTTALAPDAWPSLPLDAWEDTKDTLHLWTQVVGKIRLACAPMLNHWWQTALYVSARGLTTSLMPRGTRGLEITFDFIDHVLRIDAGEGDSRLIRLEPKSVATFYREVMAALQSLGFDVRINAAPNEVVEAIPFAEDTRHASYDPEFAQRCWRALTQAHRVLADFRARFIGKASPVHFFWGSFDLAATRFSGREAPPHPGGVPNLPDRVAREAYSHEVSSAGWWPGGGPVREAIFYSYAYPEPPGFAAVPMQPPAAYYHPELREFVLPYEAVRTAGNPDAALLEFLERTYVAAADLGRWDRHRLER
jgi:hypothetical protein